MRRLALAIAFLAFPAEAEVRTVDGDTIAIDGQRVRLFGIDSPERGQTGADEATAHLRGLIGRRDVTCAQVDYDGRNRRPVSLCSVEGADSRGARSLEQHRVARPLTWDDKVQKSRWALIHVGNTADRCCHNAG